MIWYLDREEVPNVEDIPPHVLRYLVERAEEAAGRYQKLDDYYRGNHPVLRGKKNPDEVRVAVNYARYVVDIGLGYYLGEPVKYDNNPKRRKNRDPFSGMEVSFGGRGRERGRIDLTPMMDCFQQQHISEVDQEIGKGMGIFGDCLELCYGSSEELPRPKSARIDPRCGILVCDSTVEHNKLFGMVWERRETTAREKYYFLTVYTDRTEKDYRSDDLKTAVFHQVGETREHFFGEVPMIAYENNSERQGDFEQIISLIDAYDQLMSSRLTDKKKFVDALLVFFGMTLREGDEGRLAQERFLDGAPLDARIEYIQKTFDESSVQVLADALVREMHKMTLTVDMSDEKFAGNASGQALKLKLLTMNLMVRNKIRRMEKGLKERFRLYNQWLYTMGEMEPVSINEIDVVFTVNMPIDEGEIVDMVTRLRGIVDDQTLLSQLWFIRDPAEALENIRKQNNQTKEDTGNEGRRIAGTADGSGTDGGSSPR
jgi:SPP1 family phage portal protein